MDLKWIRNPQRPFARKFGRWVIRWNWNSRSELGITSHCMLSLGPEVAHARASMRSDVDALCSNAGIGRQCRFHGIQRSKPVSEFITYQMTTLTLLTLSTKSISSNISCSATCMPQSKAAVDERHFDVLYTLL